MSIDAERLAAALSAAGVEPGRWWRSAGRGDWAAAIRTRAELLLHGARRVTTLTGAGFWRPLPWDTEQLGFAAGRVDAVVAEQIDEAYAAVAADAAAAGIRHLSARIDASQLAHAWAMERAGFVLLDGLITFARPSGLESLKLPSLPDGVRLREAAPEEASQLAALADFQHDRFHADPHVPRERADALHFTWVANSVRRTAADVVWVAEDASGPLGFTTASLDRALEASWGIRVLVIGLVGTVARARGQGIAPALAAHAVTWAREAGYAGVEVGTQLRNVSAARAYEQAGFRVVSTSLTFRLWSEL
jgi:GNAT superfamily N-acetyltransferase